MQPKLRRCWNSTVFNYLSIYIFFVKEKEKNEKKYKNNFKI